MLKCHLGMFLRVHMQSRLSCCIFRRPRIVDIPHTLHNWLSTPCFSFPPLHLPLLGLFTIYSTCWHHLSLVSPAHVSFPPSHLVLSNTEVIVSLKADKSIHSFFIFYILHLIPHSSCSHTLKTSAGQ